MKTTNNQLENQTETILPEATHIAIPKSNHNIKIIITSITIALVFISTLLLIFKDIWFPTPPKPTPPIEFPTLTFNLKPEYTVDQKEFDSEVETTHWLAKNFLRAKITEELVSLSKDWLGFSITLLGTAETDPTSHNSNMVFVKFKPSFEVLTITQLTFKYQIFKGKINSNDGVESSTYTYQKELKIMISTNQLISKLPAFNPELTLPESMIVSHDEFDSEVKTTHFHATNSLFNTLNDLYHSRSLDSTDLQRFYQVSLNGTPETDNNSNNTHIIMISESPTFTTLPLTKFTFQLQLKVRDQIVNSAYPITYQQPINLIISESKLNQKLEDRKDPKAKSNFLSNPSTPSSKDSDWETESEKGVEFTWFTL